MFQIRTFVTLLLVVLTMLMAPACGKLSGPTGPTVIHDSRNSIHLTFPDGWRASTGLNDEADLQASHSGRDIHVMVLSENAADFADGMTLDGHSELTRGILLQNTQSPEVGPPHRIQLGGYPAVQYEIKGNVNNARAMYLHTTVQTKSHFHQILAFGLRSGFEENKQELQNIVQSFREDGATQ